MVIRIEEDEQKQQEQKKDKAKETKERARGRRSETGKATDNINIREEGRELKKEGN